MTSTGEMAHFQYGGNNVPGNDHIQPALLMAAAMQGLFANNILESIRFSHTLF